MKESMRAFLDNIIMQMMYWKKLDGISLDERLNGLVFSILVEIDGEGQSPGYEMHAGDTHEIMNPCDGLLLHEAWCKMPNPNA